MLTPYPCSYYTAAATPQQEQHHLQHEYQHVHLQQELHQRHKWFESFQRQQSHFYGLKFSQREGRSVGRYPALKIVFQRGTPIFLFFLLSLEILIINKEH